MNTVQRHLKFNSVVMLSYQKEKWMKLNVRTKLVSIILTICFSPLVSANDAVIQTHCRGEWPADAEMRAHCVTEQRQAARDLKGYSGPIRAHCESEWSGDYAMTFYCIREQRSSKASVSNAPKDEIATRCAREWPSEYDMQEHCAKERRAAKENIELNYSGPIRRACEREWGTEYEMVEHCIQEQSV